MSEQTRVVVQRVRENPLYLVLAVVALLVLVFALWLLVVSPLLAPDEDVDVFVPPRAGPAGTPSPDATPTGDLPEEVVSPGIPQTGEDELALPVETFEVFLSRDPFRPIRAAPGPGDGVPGNGVGPGPGDTDGTPPTDGEPPPGDGEPPPTNGEEDGELPPTNGEDGEDGRGDRETVDGREVVLIDVFLENGEERAIVQVDGTAFEVGEGDTFAENFRVLSIDPPCVTLLFGDDAFTLCEGDRVLK